MPTPEEAGLAPCREESPATPGKVSKASFLVGQALMFYAALVSASTPVATRYLYRTPHPPQPAVLSCVQTTFAAAILILICGVARVISRACAAARGPPAPPALAPAPAPAKRVAVRRDDAARREAPLAAEGEACKASNGGGGGAAADCEAAPGGGKRQASSRGASRHTPGPGAGLDRAGSASVCLLERGGSAFSVESEGLHYGHRRSSADLGLGPRGVQRGWAEDGWRRRVATGYETARRPVARLLNHRARSLRAAGVELGLLAFTANAVMVYGFTMTTVGRGAFLIRASIIFTPILSTLAGERVPRGLWVGAVIGFIGSVMISLDPVKKARERPKP